MKRKRRYGRIILILAALSLFGFLFLGGPNGLFRILSLWRKKTQLEEEQEVLKAKIEILKYEKYKLQYDPDYIKRVAKDRFRMVEEESLKTRKK